MSTKTTLLHTISMFPFLLLFQSSFFVRGETSASSYRTTVINPYCYAESVVDAARWAVNELQHLSDSDIYETLSLESILFANVSQGVLHERMTRIRIGLGSPYFDSKNETETFDLVVLEPYQNRRRSFAINEFPNMDEEMVESFWIEKKERLRRERMELIRRFVEQRSSYSSIHHT